MSSSELISFKIQKEFPFPKEIQVSEQINVPITPHLL